MESATESRLQNLGGSLLVENVQSLASRNLTDIPLKYIRQELAFDQISFESSLQIPVIDLSKLGEDDQFDANELTRLHLACKDWGFFQVINHGVTEAVIEKMKNDITEFFKQSLEVKMKCRQGPNSIEGYGQAFVISEDQKLDWGDMLFIIAQPPSQRNLRFWPSAPTSFREATDEYSIEVEKLAKQLLRSMAKNLGLEKEKLASMFEGGVQGLRMNYYPPCIHASKVMGLTPHSDATGLTLLSQINEVQGLQIKKDGEWIPIKPVPGAFIVNIGDILEIMSNGEYKSIEHRAVVNPEKERLSVAAFHNPNMRTMIGPLPELTLKNKTNYKTSTHEEYIRLVVSTKLNGKSLLKQIKLVN